MIPIEKWVWYGHAVHLIVASACRFHLCTRIGGVIVSSVGDYYPPGGVRETIGSGENDFFETFVMNIVSGPGCTDPECGCAMPYLDFSNIVDSVRTGSARECMRAHMRLCRKYAKKEAA